VDGPDAFCVTRRWFATFEYLTRRPLTEVEFAQALSQPEDEACFADVRRMLKVRIARG
jgi:hypothetical protein